MAQRAGNNGNHTLPYNIFHDFYFKESNEIISSLDDYNIIAHDTST